jgi:hypothetical protein
MAGLVPAIHALRCCDKHLRRPPALQQQIINHARDGAEPETRQIGFMVTDLLWRSGRNDSSF